MKTYRKTSMSCFGSTSSIQTRHPLALVGFLIGSLLLANPPGSQAAPGDLDLSFDPGSSLNGEVRGLVVQTNGSYVIVGNFKTVPGAMRNRAARFYADGAADPEFAPEFAQAGYPYFSVEALALQPDGKMLIGGTFSSVNGVTRSNLVRLHPDGSTDFSFLNELPGPAGPLGTTVVGMVVVQGDGKILVAGSFTAINGIPRTNLARLHANGSLDTSFLNGLAGPNGTTHGSVSCLAVQSDGKVLIGGDFTLVNGVSRPKLARLHTNGSLDHSFLNGLAGPDGYLRGVAVQADGRVLIAGRFQAVNGVARTNLTRLNADGSLDATFPASLQTVGPGGLGPVFVLQGDGRILIGGGFALINGVGRTNLARLHPDGRLDESFLAQLPSMMSTDGGVSAFALQPDGKVLVSGISAMNPQNPYLSRLNADGSPDNTCDPGRTGPNGRVSDLAVQPDGRLLIAGGFEFVNGVRRGHVARLLADGALDDSFLNGLAGADRGVTLALQSDGKVVIGGDFDVVNGVARRAIARLENDGTLDEAYAPSLEGYARAAYVLLLQPDGKILIGGSFNSVNGLARTNLARLNPDGSTDASFVASASGNISSVGVVALQPDGRIVIGGYFSVVNGVSRNRIARLHSDGSLDTSFLNGLSGGDQVVNAIAIQSDGKILVGGWFESFNGVARKYLVRLNANGSLDASFLAGLAGPDGGVDYLALQSDGKILVGGGFNNFNGVARGNLARLHADGSLDRSFLDGLAGADQKVWHLAVLPDTRLVIAGEFAAVNGVPRRSVARLLENYTYPVIETPPSDQTVNAGAAAQFTLGADGAAPLSFQWFKDALALTDDARRSGAQTPSLTISNASRADEAGYSAVVSNAYGSVTSQVARLTVLDPALVSQPASLSVAVGGNAQFSVVAAGTLPLGFQWLKDGLALAEGGRISGAQTATLTLSNVLSSDAGEYAVIVTNTSGSVTSLVASLSIGPSPGGNLLLNGDFESGNVGFTSGYSYVPGSTMLGEGDYVLVTDPRLAHPSGASFGDHTTGSGLMLALNGSPNANTVVWGQTVNVLPGNAYVFSGWAATWGRSDPGPDPSPPVLRFVINGQPQGTDVTLNAPVGHWQPFAVTWHSGSATSAILQIYDLNLAGGGNDFALDDLQFAAVSAGPPTILTGPQSQTAPAGGSASFSVQAGGAAPLSYQWLKDGLALADGGRISGAQAVTLTLSAVPATDHGGYRVVVTNAAGSVTSAVATLTVSLAVVDSMAPAFNWAVNCLAETADQKILVGGGFSLLGGFPHTALARLNWDGTPDHAFHPALDPNAAVVSLAVQADGHILVAGRFTTHSGGSPANLCRFSPSGELDASFDTGATNSIQCVAQQSDGKIIVGCYLDTFPSAPRGVVRLTAAGTVDPTFTAAPDSGVGCLVVQPDDKILIAGGFDSVNGQPRNRVARLNADGALDPTFVPSPNPYPGLHGSAYALALQPDGKVLVGGFPIFGEGDHVQSGIARLNPDGRLDATFRPTVDSGVGGITLQRDGKILFGGLFTTVNGTPRSHLARLLPDGTLDPFFDPGANSMCLAFLEQPDHTTLVGGVFTVLGGQPRTYLGRLLLYEPPAPVIWPAAQTVELGAAARFDARDPGYPLPAYRWFHGGQLLDTVTNGLLQLPAVGVADAGSYAVGASNIAGVATSGPATLAVIPRVERRVVPGLVVTGEVGSTQNVAGTAALGPAAQWQPVTNVLMTSAAQWCFDLSAPLPPQMFYRSWQTGQPGLPPVLVLPGFIPALTLTGGVGSQVRVDGINQFGPTDSWFTLDTVTLTNTSQHYFDVSVIGQPARLYRLMPMP